MEQQEQQNIKRPKNVEYIYLKNSCFLQDFGPDKQGIFRGMEQSPDQRGTSNSDEGLKKRGTIVVITPARNQWVSQQCRINRFIP